ncbi:MAG: beta-propeller domain-containing protein [Candidatus Nanoarchaeia archaeon]
MKRTIFILIVAVLLIQACTTENENSSSENNTLELGTYNEQSYGIPEKIEKTSFKDNSELSSFLQQHEGSSENYRRMVSSPEMVEDADEVSASAPKDSQSRDFSETNIQIEGVDEADILKTDGEYIYTITEKTLYVIKAYPGEEAEVLSSIEFENTPESLFVKDNKLAVFGDISTNDDLSELELTREGATFFNIYSVDDKKEPSLEKEYKFEGNYFDARMINGEVYFMAQSRPQHRQIPTPIIYEGTTKQNVELSDVSRFNIPYQNPQFLTIHSISLDDNELEDSETLTVEHDPNLFMSENNIFITYTERINEYELEKEIIKELLEDKLTQKDKELIEKIKKTDNDILTQSEKESKIMEVYERHVRYMPQDEEDKLEDKAKELLKKKLEELEHMEYTIINKIKADQGGIEASANGKVPGHIINQFSMDEKDSILRIATTISPRWSRFEKENTESANNVYTLNKDLEVLGSLEGLAEDESIYSTRFIGDKLYMVTFKQVDPFFVIDLSDPENPENLGELKIPGFSRYLHPYDEDTIIGIGKNATETGRTKGLKISLFDVSDFENPKEVASFVTDERYAQSNALYEHKAFMFSKEKNLLVIPAVNNDHRRRESQEQDYNGAFVFNISKDNIELRGLIDHSISAANNQGPAVERSLYIEDLLYTKSQNLLRINALSDLRSVNNVTLEKSGGDIPVY